MVLHFSTTFVVLLAWLATCSSFTSAVQPKDKESAEFSVEALDFFETQVRPLLVRRCYECHSAKSDELQGGLRLDSRAAILRGGDTGPALVPRKPKESLLVDAINYGDLYEMPPKSKLPSAEIATLTKWVKMGAPWPKEADVSIVDKKEFDLDARRKEHWCWQPIQAQSPPTVKDTHWPRQPLDRFILSKLEKKGFSPNPAADRRTLIRRVYFDVIGLPPTPQQVDDFVNDRSPQAFEKVVDRLLRSPHFGERWVRHWMDLVRYAETYGHEFDYQIPHATEYRDYLIRAFNADVPYDQLLTEHIAGDLLAEPRRHPSEGYNESVIATGFWELGEATHAPVDVLGDEAGRLDNQIDVFSKTFLGLTLACARCHDHKFDAISTKDYYAMAGMLKSSRRQEAFLDPGARIAKASEELTALQEQASETLRSAVANSTLNQPGMFSHYLLAAQAATAGEASHRKSAEEAAAEFGVDAEILNRWIASLGDSQAKDKSHPMRAWTELTSRQQVVAMNSIGSLRMRLSDESARGAESASRSELFWDFGKDGFDGWFVTGHAFGMAPTAKASWDALRGNISTAEAGVAHSGMLSKRMQGVLRSPTFTIKNRNILYRIAGSNAQVRLIVDNYFMDVFNSLLFRGFSFNVNTDGQFRWQTQSQDVGRYIGHRAHIEIIDHGDGYVAVDEIRFSDGGPPQPRPNSVALRVANNKKVNSLKSLAKAYENIWQDVSQRWIHGNTTDDESEFVRWVVNQGLLPIDKKSATQLDKITKTYVDKSSKVPSPRRVLAISDGTGLNSKIYIRGNHRTLGEIAPRSNLTAFGSFPKLSPEDGSGRLILARQLTDPSNPLVSRVFVNRVWHHLFGRGIVGSVDNFGVLGQRPTHPHLLDYLAAEFMKDGWSVKRLIRSIVLSSTYQMSSTPNDLGSKLDPENLLLHRMRIRRLEGEAIRDAILQVSGRLDPKTFGSSVPVHLTSFMQGRGRPRGSGPLDGNGRRSIYTAVRRNFLPPMMLAFDTPIPFSSVGRRNVSNVPAQALILMNDPFVVQQMKIWAKRLLAEQGTAEQRIQQMYEAAFSRLPDAGELNSALAFLDGQGRELGLAPDAARNDPRVWADLCHVIVNVKEFIFIR